MSFVYTHEFNQYMNLINTTAPTGACLLYILAYVQMKKRFANMANSAFSAAQKRTQIRLTVTLGMSTLVTGVYSAGLILFKNYYSQLLLYRTRL